MKLQLFCIVLKNLMIRLIMHRILLITDCLYLHCKDQYSIQLLNIKEVLKFIVKQPF